MCWTFNKLLKSNQFGPLRFDSVRPDDSICTVCGKTAKQALMRDEASLQSSLRLQRMNDDDDF